jgi:hypothetical protein
MRFPYAIYNTFSENFNFKTEAVNNIKFVFQFYGSVRLVALYIVASVLQKLTLSLSGRMQKQLNFFQNVEVHIPDHTVL